MWVVGGEVVYWGSGRGVVAGKRNNLMRAVFSWSFAAVWSGVVNELMAGADNPEICCVANQRSDFIRRIFTSILRGTGQNYIVTCSF